MKVWTHRCKAAHHWCFPPTAETFQMSWNTTTEQVGQQNPGSHGSLLLSQTHQQRATFLTVYPPPPSTSRGILKLFTNSTQSLKHNVSKSEGRLSKVNTMLLSVWWSNKVATTLLKTADMMTGSRSVSGVFSLSSVGIKALSSRIWTTSDIHSHFNNWAKSYFYV